MSYFIFYFLVPILIAYGIAYLASWNAIRGVLDASIEEAEDSEVSNLIELRDLGVLDNNQLEVLIAELTAKRKNDSYHKYLDSMKHLLENEFFTREEYEEKKELLKTNIFSD